MTAFATTARIRAAVLKRISDQGMMEIRVAAATLANIMRDCGFARVADHMLEQSFDTPFYEVPAEVLEPLVEMAERESLRRLAADEANARLYRVLDLVAGVR